MLYFTLAVPVFSFLIILFAMPPCEVLSSLEG